MNKEAVGGSIVATNSTVNVADGSDSMKGRNGAENGTVTINGSTDGVAVMVAAITYPNSDYYHAFATLKAAVEYAQAGQTVTLLRDVTGAGVVIDKDITIDFGGKTYTVNQTVGSTGTTTLGLQILKDNNVTLKNGTLTSTAAVEGSNEVKMLVQNYANLTVDNMKLVDDTDHILYVLSNNSGEVKVVNGSVISSDAVALDACKYASYAAPTVNVAEGVTVNGNVEVSATLNMNGTLNGTIVINGASGTVNGAEGLTVKAMDGYNVAYAGGAYTVVEKHYVAQVGEQKYETFAAAVAAAPAGSTITLIDDATENATVVLTKNLTINGADKTFTGAIEFNKSNGYFTIKNVNFNGAGTHVYALKSQTSTTTLTVEGCTATAYTFGFLYANSAIANVTVSDVTVKDVNYGVHSARGTNVTLNNFVAENVKYGVMLQNYSGRNVVLNNCSFTDSENPLFIWERNQTNKITFNFEGANEMGKADFCASAMAVVNADAVVGTKVCGTLAAAVEAAQAGETVTLLRNVQLSTFLTINKSITLNMGEYNITRDGGTALYVNGDVEVTINGTNGTVTGSQAVWVANGLVKINGGNFCGVAEAVYVQNTGKAEIYSGTFSSSEYGSFVLNKKDDSRETASITVYGGTFVGFNPANNAAEGKGTNFVAAGLIAVDNGDDTYGIAKANVKMGDSYYATLAEAIAAVGSGDVVIELLADATLNYGAREAYGTAETATVTIAGNGKTLTLNQTNSDWSSFGLAAGKVVFNDMTIEKTGHGDTNGAWNKHAIIFSSPVEMNNVTVNNSVAVQAGATLSNVTINEAGEYYGLWINGNGQNVTINGGAINATNAGRGIKIADQYIDAPEQVTLNVVGTAFSTAKKAAVLVSSKAGAKITADKVNIENVVADQVNFVWVDEDWAQHFANVQVEGATVAQEGIEGFVAQLPNGASYKTLAAAITAATSGQTITLIGDVKESVTITKNLTIDGAGKQYTGIIALQKVNATIKNVNFIKGQIAKEKSYTGGNVTILGCTFDGQGLDSYAVNVARTTNIVIEGVTAKNYGYGFLQVSHANSSLSIKNLSVENVNYALKVDYSGGVTIDGLNVKDVKVAAIYNSNYGTKTYTITNSDFSGAVEAIKMWERNTTVYNTFVFAGGNTLGDATLSTSPYAIYKGVVAEVGNKKYLDLRAAFDAAKDGDIVKLLEDVELTDADVIQVDKLNTFYHIAGKNITFDMNEKNITVTYNSGNYLYGIFLVDSGFTVTGNGCIDIPQTDRQVAYMFLKRGSEGYLVIENGNFHAGNLEDSMIYTNSDNVVTVKGGTFVIDNVAERPNGCPWIFNTKGQNVNSVNVHGGIYNFNVGKQHYKYEVKLDAGMTMTKIDEKLWTLAPAVAAVGEDSYATLAEAIAAASEDATVTMVTDVVLTEGITVPADKTITLDLNGKTVSANIPEDLKKSFAAITNKGTLTVKDSSAEGNGNITVSYGGASFGYSMGLYTISNEGGTLNIKGGTIENTATVTGSMYDAIDNNSTLGETVLNISGGTVKCGYIGIRQFANNSTYDNFVNVTGGKVVGGNTSIWMQNPGSGNPKATIEISAGTVDGRLLAGESTGFTYAISGGIFTTEILPEWCAQYYVPTKNDNGTYGVIYTYVEEMTIVDGDYTEFVNEMNKTVGTLTYERSFARAGNNWQALYVPFEIPVQVLTDLGFEVAFFLDVHFEYDDVNYQITGAPTVHIIKITEGTLKANFPYVIRNNNSTSDLSLVLNDVTLYNTNDVNVVESSSTTTKFVFAGSYKSRTRAELNGSDEIPCYLLNNSGKMQKIGPSVMVNPFRVYMSIINKEGSPFILDDLASESIKMRVIGEQDGETTDIKYYEYVNNQNVDFIYDLQGRRVLEPKKGGIYIINGKKVYYNK